MRRRDNARAVRFLLKSKELKGLTDNSGKALRAIVDVVVDDIRELSSQPLDEIQPSPFTVKRSISRHPFEPFQILLRWVQGESQEPLANLQRLGVAVRHESCEGLLDLSLLAEGQVRGELLDLIHLHAANAGGEHVDPSISD